MSKCANCGNEYEPKRKTSKYCSAKCRKLAFQADAKVSVPENDGVSVLSYELIPDTKVYGRPAVRYDFEEAWERRPEPLSPEDRPKPDNRGKYIRPDGSEYQFDAIGQVFECDRARGNQQAVNEAMWTDNRFTKPSKVGLHGAQVLGIDPNELADDVFNA